MSTTVTMTEAPPAPAIIYHSSSCPNCGIGLSGAGSQVAEDAQKLIEDLQAQVRLLTQKATAAVDKWADYEDELQRLRSSHQQTQAPPLPPSPDPSITTPITRPLANRLSSFLSVGRSTPNLSRQNSETASQALSTPIWSQPPTPSEKEITLEAALSREQSLRQKAEGQLDKASGEMEELSAQLFQQANEMVATERKARAKLEARVEVLERRDKEKRKRLERLEGALGRIERVRGMLGPERP